MLRAIGAVVLGYVVMAVFVFVTFSIVYTIMGATGAFKPGTYEISMQWIVASFVLGLVAAIAGGFVCALIARGGKAPLALAVLVLVLGGLAAIPALTGGGEEKPPRTDDIGNLEAMQYAETPPMVALLNPVVGVIGVLIGARMHGGAKPAG